MAVIEPNTEAGGHKMTRYSPCPHAGEAVSEGKMSRERPSTWVFKVRKNSASWFRDKGKEEGSPGRHERLSKGSEERTARHVVGERGGRHAGFCLSRGA